MPAQDAHHFRDFSMGGGANAVSFTDCQFHGGLLYSSLISDCAFTNCLFRRVFTTVDDGSGDNVSPWFQNNLFFGGTLRLAHCDCQSGTWALRDNFFDHTDLIHDGGYGDPGPIDADYNGYLTAGSERPWPGAHDVVANFSWQSGPLGIWYQPWDSGLTNKGHTTADLVGLFHTTTQTNQVKQTNSTVDIGLHFPAVSNATTTITTTYDAAQDFSLNSNPNGVWSYGYSQRLGGALTLHAEALTDCALDIRRTDIWLGAPCAFHNPAGEEAYCGTITMEANALGFHPGPNGEFSIIRFTAPAAGRYLFRASFAGADTQDTTTDVHILRNGVCIFGGAVNSFGSGPSANGDIVLAEGETLDFAVGYGSNNGFTCDATAVSIQIDAVSASLPAQPIDTDGDTIPDYLEDLNGNGLATDDPTSWLEYTSLNGLSAANGLQVFTPLK